jgi:hypothetical protein
MTPEEFDAKWDSGAVAPPRWDDPRADEWLQDVEAVNATALDTEARSWLNGRMTTQMPHLEDHTYDPDDEFDTAEYHERGAAGGPCFGCWCYSCGGRTDRPRIEHAPEIERHPGDPSHRWCFE